jgi:hypothetical protein
MKILLITSLLFPVIALAENCNEEIAFKNGVKAIKENFPKLYETKKPYKLVVINRSWVVLGHTLAGMRGGGAPEASINKHITTAIKSGALLMTWRVKLIRKCWRKLKPCSTHCLVSDRRRDVALAAQA